jgi:hypothetical protein
MKWLTGIAVVVVVAAVVIPLLTEMVWVGHRELSIIVTVRDEESGQPIDGAEVLLRTSSTKLPPYPKEALQRAFTARAVVTFSQTFMMSGRDGIFGRRSGSVNTAGHIVQAVHPGFESSWSKLVEFAGPGSDCRRPIVDQM